MTYYIPVCLGACLYGTVFSFLLLRGGNVVIARRLVTGARSCIHGCCSAAAVRAVRSNCRQAIICRRAHMAGSRQCASGCATKHCGKYPVFALPAVATGHLPPTPSEKHYRRQLPWLWLGPEGRCPRLRGGHLVKVKCAISLIGM